MQVQRGHDMTPSLDTPLLQRNDTATTPEIVNATAPTFTSALPSKEISATQTILATDIVMDKDSSGDSLLGTGDDSQKLSDDSVREIRLSDGSSGSSSLAAGTAAMCAILRHEELYIDEWVDYHLAIGFSPIFLYDNTEEFDMKDWGKDRRPAVTVIHYPGGGRQMEAYMDCTTRLAYNHTWTAYFDIDEFLVLKKHGSVIEFLHDNLRSGALAINWLVFGTSNQTEYRAEPVTLRFQYREEDTANNQHVKLIARTADVQGPMPTPHNMVLKDNRVTLTTNGVLVDGPLNENPDYRVAALHHYQYKSHKEYISKRQRGRGDVAGVQEDLIRSAEKGEHPPGSIYDDSAWQTLKRLVPKYRAYETASVV